SDWGFVSSRIGITTQRSAARPCSAGREYTVRARGRCIALLGRRGLRTPWLGCMVVKDATEDRTSLRHFRWVGEAGFPHEAENRVSRVVAQVLAPVKQMSEEPVGTVACPAKIKQVQGAAWSEHATYLAQASLLLIAVEVVEHEGRKDSI